MPRQIVKLWTAIEENTLHTFRCFQGAEIRRRPCFDTIKIGMVNGEPNQLLVHPFCYMCWPSECLRNHRKRKENRRNVTSPPPFTVLAQKRGYLWSIQVVSTFQNVSTLLLFWLPLFSDVFLLEWKKNPTCSIWSSQTKKWEHYNFWVWSPSRTKRQKKSPNQRRGFRGNILIETTCRAFCAVAKSAAC